MKPLLHHVDFDLDGPKHKLIAAGLDFFGKRGRDGVSTRTIAEAAGVNHAAISYYFGGKDGLYLAVAEHVALFMRNRIQPWLERLQRELANTPPNLQTLSNNLAGLASAMLSAMTSAACEQVPDPMSYVMREYAQPGPAFDVLYERNIQQVHTVLTGIAASARGLDPDSEEAVLRAHASLGLIISFFLARPVLLRRAGWEGGYPPDAAQRIIPLALDMLCASIGLPEPEEISDTGEHQ